MFDSQFCSLASLSFLVLILGLVIAISFRLRSEDSLFNLAGLFSGLALMGISSVACLVFDPSCGIIQGVAVVAVAIGSTIRLDEPRPADF